MKKKNLLTEAQITRFAAMAGIPALGTVSNIVSEKVEIQAEEADTEETVTENEEAETEATNEEIVAEEEMEMDAEAEAPAEEEVSQEKIESLVDAVLAAIESETGVPAQRVDDEAPADDAPEMDAEEPEMDAEEPEEEMMEETTPSLAERIAAAVQTVLDEDAGLEESNCTTNEEEEELEEGSCSTNEEEDVDEGYKADKDDDEKMKESSEDQLEENPETNLFLAVFGIDFSKDGMKLFVARGNTGGDDNDDKVFRFELCYFFCANSYYIRSCTNLFI